MEVIWLPNIAPYRKAPAIKTVLFPSLLQRIKHIVSRRNRSMWREYGAATMETCQNVYDVVSDNASTTAPHARPRASSWISWDTIRYRQNPAPAPAAAHRRLTRNTRSPSGSNDTRCKSHTKSG